MTAVEAPPFSEGTNKRLAQMWGLADDSGITAARRSLDAAIEAHTAALDAEVAARIVLRDRQEALDDATVEAEWAAETAIVTEGARSFIVTGDQRRPVTAESRKAWKAATLAADTDLAEARRQVADAEDQAARARADVTKTAARVSAAKHGLDAAVAVLNLLALALPH